MAANPVPFNIRSNSSLCSGSTSTRKRLFDSEKRIKSSLFIGSPSGLSSGRYPPQSPAKAISAIATPSPPRSGRGRHGPVVFQWRSSGFHEFPGLLGVHFWNAVSCKALVRKYSEATELGIGRTDDVNQVAGLFQVHRYRAADIIHHAE